MSPGQNRVTLPGQVVAASIPEETAPSADFLRGHGTYFDRLGPQDRLISSVCGVVRRVNKLISVVPVDSSYHGHVGDLVVGRVTGVGPSRWRISLSSACRHAQLPLSGISLPGGAQRVRTAEDQLSMRRLLTEGDLVCAEVLKVQPSDGSLVLHARSPRYLKLENGLLANITPALVPRMKNHVVSMVGGSVDTIWGLNGKVWIQLRDGDGPSADSTPADHTTKKITSVKGFDTSAVGQGERERLSRLKNAIECLQFLNCTISPSLAEDVYRCSLEKKLRPSEILIPSNAVRLYEAARSE